MSREKKGEDLRKNYHVCIQYCIIRDINRIYTHHTFEKSLLF